jgi:plastocyanin
MTRTLVAAALTALVSSAAAAQSVPVTLSEWKVEMARDTVRAGTVTFRVKNEGTMMHSLYVEGQGVKKETPQIAANQTMSLSVTLVPGTYEVYCPMSEMSHKKAGMTRKLIVVEGTKKGS